MWVGRHYSQVTSILVGPSCLSAGCYKKRVEEAHAAPCESDVCLLVWREPVRDTELLS